MYKKIIHNIVEEHYDHPAIMPVGMRPKMTNETPENEEDVVKFNIPLILKLLEWAREESSKDMELHIVVERMIELSENGDTLTMTEYPEIVCMDPELYKKK